jgi:vesicle coat complex subunit
MAMTLGKDVSQLFPDVLKNIATADLDQKKLVYLYLMSVSKGATQKTGVRLKITAGTMPNLTLTSVSSLSTPSYKTPKTLTH